MVAGECCRRGIAQHDMRLRPDAMQTAIGRSSGRRVSHHAEDEDRIHRRSIAIRRRRAEDTPRTHQQTRPTSHRTVPIACPLSVLPWRNDRAERRLRRLSR